MTDFGPDPDVGPDPKGESLDVRVARLEERARNFATREWVKDHMSKRWQTWVPILISLIALILLIVRLLTHTDLSSVS
ncbi:MAG: hypothetical protein OXC11_15790 [Rhodospirillales bacterium]|nr:hypothetical protein [Rhodospirillales bacterium]